MRTEYSIILSMVVDHGLTGGKRPSHTGGVYLCHTRTRRNGVELSGEVSHFGDVGPVRKFGMSGLEECGIHEIPDTRRGIAGYSAA